MGAWGAGSFDNDTAMDWIGQLERHGLDAIIDAIEAIGEGFIDSDEGSVAIAAGEVVAALRGKPAKELPDDVVAWVAASRADLEVSPEIIRDIARVIREVRSRDELHDLWDDEGAAEWLAVVDKLLARLS